jgi:hypothetical protein
LDNQYRSLEVHPHPIPEKNLISPCNTGKAFIQSKKQIHQRQFQPLEQKPIREGTPCLAGKGLSSACMQKDR